MIACKYRSRGVSVSSTKFPFPMISWSSICAFFSFSGLCNNSAITHSRVDVVSIPAENKSCREETSIVFEIKLQNISMKFIERDTADDQERKIVCKVGFPNFFQQASYSLKIHEQFQN